MHSVLVWKSMVEKEKLDLEEKATNFSIVYICLMKKR